MPRSLGKTQLLKYKLIMTGSLLLAFPFLLFPTGYGVFALLLLPVAWLFRWRAMGHILPRTPFDWSLLLMLTMVLVSIWATPDISFSIGKVAGVLFGIALYYLIVDLSATGINAQKVTMFYFLVGVGLAIISILGMKRLTKFPLLVPIISKLPAFFQGVPGAEGGFSTNQVGGVLLFFIPLQVTLFIGYLKTKGHLFTKKSYTKLSNWNTRGLLAMMLIGMAIFITFGVLLLTQSRGALGGLLVGLIAILAIQTRWGKILAVTGTIVLIVILSSGMGDELISSNGVQTTAVGTIHLDGRLEIWSRALYGLADFPFTGMGMNMFRRVMPILYPTFIVPTTMDIAHAHNHLLQAGLDLGLPGLIAYLSLWLLAGFLLYQTIQKTESLWQRTMALGLLGGFVAYFVYGLTDTVALGAKPGFVFWWALALVVAVYQLETVEGIRNE